jgi:hypothetical protein
MQEEAPRMDNKYLHTFRLVVDGLPEPVEFHMFHELEDVAMVTDSFAKYVARQEDDFLPLGATAAVRASKVIHLVHVKFAKADSTRQISA